MNRAVWIEGAAVDLASCELLATGGEARVYAVGSCALKLWHAPSTARARKLDALLARRRALPPTVVMPEHAARGPRGEVVGFTMPLLPQTFEPIAVLGSAAHRAARAVTQAATLRVLGRLLDALATLHAAGVVIGDLSDQNVSMDVGASDPIRILDVDSFQLDGLPCEVTTEAFLDPLLYGPDVAHPCLTAHGAPRTFSPQSDSYAFEVLLFRALAGAHPYGGALDALPTLPRRALARASLLRDEVRTPPRVREAIRLLDPTLRSHLEATFERGERSAMSPSLLEACGATLVTCGCGLEVPASLLPCPRCAKHRAAPSAHRGSMRVSVVLEAAGLIVAVASAGDAILAVAIERGLPHLYRSTSGGIERFALATDVAPSGWDVALASDLAAVAPRGSGAVAPLGIARLMPRGIASALTTTERARGTAAIAVAHDVLFRVARGTVLAGRLEAGKLSERPVATVLAGGGRLLGVTLGERAGAVAVGAVLGLPRWELITPRGATSLDAPALSPGETLREVTAHGDAEGVTVLARTRIAHRGIVRFVRFDLAGRRIADRSTPEDARAAEDVIGGGAGRSGAVILATARGLVREDATGAERRFADTASFTVAGAPIALTRGAILVADGRVVRRIELR